MVSGFQIVFFRQLMDLRYMINGIFRKTVHAKLHVGAKIFMSATAVVAGITVFCVIGNDLVTGMIAERFGLRAGLVNDAGNFMTERHRQHSLGAFFKFAQMAGQRVSVRSANGGVDDFDTNFVIGRLRNWHLSCLHGSHGIFFEITNRSNI